MANIIGNVRKRKPKVGFVVDLSITAQTRQPAFEGRPCGRCDSTLRFERDKRCVRCHRQWRRDNEARYYRKYGNALFRRLGMTPEKYVEMCEAQDWSCRICGEIPTNKLHVDHDHKTMRIRGLLCGACNVGLGHFQENPERLQSAIEYLRQC